MIKLNAYKIPGTPFHANITPLSAKRNWMDETAHKHAYRCFPLTLSNQVGWGLSFPEDITFMWDGVTSTYPDNVKVLQGEKYCETGRGHSTINFKTNLRFVTDKNYSLLSFPVPNHFVDGATAITSILSTSFFEGPLPVAWKITRPFTPITIKANDPIIAIMPISLSELNNSTVNLDQESNAPVIKRDIPLTLEGAMEAAEKARIEGRWTDYYRDAVDYMGNSLGEHEVKSLKLNVKGLY
jgi:hypothetical protein